MYSFPEKSYRGTGHKLEILIHSGNLERSLSSLGVRLSLCRRPRILHTPCCLARDRSGGLPSLHLFWEDPFGTLCDRPQQQYQVAFIVDLEGSGRLWARGREEDEPWLWRETNAGTGTGFEPAKYLHDLGPASYPVFTLWKEHSAYLTRLWGPMILHL